MSRYSSDLTRTEMRSCLKFFCICVTIVFNYDMDIIRINK